jgi:hypothetical protein
MMNNTDKFFKEKLGSFETNVPPSAWNRVEKNINSQPSRGWWLQIAASVAVLMAVLFIAFKYNNQTSESIANNNDIKTSGETQKKSNNEIAQIDSTASDRHKSTDVKQKTQQKVKTKKNTRQPSRSEKVEHRSIQPSENFAMNEEQKVLVDPNEEAVAPLEQNETVAIAEIKEEKETGHESQSVTLVYSAAEVNAKYLNKNITEEATSDSKKPSTLRKLLDKAYDLKHNQDPFGELRQKKNEILALNFKNEKERSQNR